jgi:hypothetical protein
MKAALKRGVDTGALLLVKNSYKVSADAKKAPKPKKVAVKAAKTIVKKVMLCADRKEQGTFRFCVFACSHPCTRPRRTNTDDDKEKGKSTFECDFCQGLLH